VLTGQSNGAAPPSWKLRYVRRIIVIDLALVSLGLIFGGVVGYGNAPKQPYLAVLLAIATGVTFVGSMVAARAWEPHVLGRGHEEINRLLRAGATTGVMLALVGLACQLTATRPWVFGIIPATVLLIGLSRYQQRQWLYRKRAEGECLQRVLVVGGEAAISDLVTRTERDRHHGWVVAGACTPGGADTGGSLRGVPVVGDLDAVSTVARDDRFGVVAVAPGDGLSPRRLHQLAWDLEGLGIELVVHPGLMEVSGPRLHVSLVDGMPLLRLTEPRLAGASRALKVVADKAGAALLLLGLAPLLLLIWFAVRRDGGPALYRQTRIGLCGKPFRMLKFRSMVVDADRLRAGLATANQGAGPLFKLRSDPRVTRVGATLRRYSLDELPQLFNVLGGSMSLVGPRPPLPAEVERYSRSAQRRLLVKPGLTGLWQISGRSDLSWEETVRLDLRYVENWSLALDGLILWKTFRAVVGGVGAY
jgi:exopolysaccharide biosynthesis polyprenyl glycosylphosphotransferase